MKNILLSLLAMTAIGFAHESKTKTQVQSKDAKKEVIIKHSGGTDSSGCHYNHKTGVYHCH